MSEEAKLRIVVETSGIKDAATSMQSAKGASLDLSNATKTLISDLNNLVKYEKQGADEASKAADRKIADINNLIKYEHQLVSEKQKAAARIKATEAESTKASIEAANKAYQVKIDDINAIIKYEQQLASEKKTLEAQKLATEKAAAAQRLAEEKEVSNALIQQQKELEQKRIASEKAIMSANQAAVSAQNQATSSIIASKRNEANAVVSDLHKQIAAENEALAAKLRAAAQNGIISAQFVAHSKLETNQRISDIKRQIAAQTDYSRKSNRFFSGITRQLTSSAAAYLSFYQAIRLAKSAIDAVASYQTLERQLEFLTGSANAAAQELEYLTRASDKYGTVLLQSTESYAALASAMTMSGVSMQGVHKTYEAISSIAATFALRQDKVNAILLAFTQIAGKGRVQSEELVRQLGQYLPALQIGAKAMGMSIAEFNKALKAGTVASGEFIPKFAELSNAMYGQDVARKTDTITAAQNRFSTALSETFKELAQNTGVASAYKGVLEALADAMGRAVDKGDVYQNNQIGLASVLGMVTKEGKKTADVLSNMANFGGGNAALTIGNIPKQMAEVDASFGFTKQQINSIRGLLSSMSNEDLVEFQKGVNEAFGDEANLTDSAKKKLSDLHAILNEYIETVNKTNFDKMAKSFNDAYIKIVSETDDMFSKFDESKISDTQKKIDAAIAPYNAQINAIISTQAAIRKLREEGKSRAEITASLREQHLLGTGDTVESFEADLKRRNLSLQFYREEERKGIKKSSADRLKLEYGTDQEILKLRKDIAEAQIRQEGKALGLSKEQIDAYVASSNSKLEEAARKFDEAHATIPSGLKKYLGQSEELIDIYYNDLKDKVAKMVASGELTPEAGAKVTSGIETERGAAKYQSKRQFDQFGTDYQTQIQAAEQKKQEDLLQTRLDAESTFQNASREAWDTYWQKMTETSEGQNALIQGYGAMLTNVMSSAQSNLEGFMSIAEEGSATYKALYVQSKSLAIAQATIDAYLAYSAVLSDKTINPMWLRNTLAYTQLSLGLANVAMITAQSVAGFKDGGVFSGKPGVDKNIVAVSDGEGFIKPSAVKAIGGEPVINYINEYGELPSYMKWTGHGYANGGVEGNVASTYNPNINVGGSNVSVSIQNNTGGQISQNATVTQTADGMNMQLILDAVDNHMTRNMVKKQGVFGSNMAKMYQSKG